MKILKNQQSCPATAFQETQLDKAYHAHECELKATIELSQVTPDSKVFRL